MSLFYNLSSSGRKKGLPEFTYTGQYTRIDSTHPTTGEARFALQLTTTGNLTLDRNAVVDYFLLNGGDSGTTSNYYGGGGSGGNGGARFNRYGVPLTKNTVYPVTIGMGATAIFSQTSVRGGVTTFNGDAPTGYGSAGGYGGEYPDEGDVIYPVAGRNGIPPFDAQHDELFNMYGPGGGGGGFGSGTYNGKPGGQVGGGAGADRLGSSRGGAGAANMGAGGGGGNASSSLGGNGGSGLAIILFGDWSA